jgi:hypothetical protein
MSLLTFKKIYTSSYTSYTSSYILYILCKFFFKYIGGLADTEGKILLKLLSQKYQNEPAHF